MKKETSFFKKYLFLLDKDKYVLIYFIILSLVASSIELLALALIGPYSIIIIDPNTEIIFKIQSYFSDFGYSFTKNNIITIFSIALIIIFFIKSILTIITFSLIKLFCNKKILNIRKDLSIAFLNMPYTRYLKKKNSEFIFTLHSLVEKFVTQVLNNSIVILSEIIIAISIIIFLGFQDILLLLSLTILMSLVILIYDLNFRKKSVTYGKESALYGQLLTKSIQESMYGYKEVRIFKKEKYFTDLIQENSKKYNKFNFKSYMIGFVPRYIFEFFIITFLSVSIIIIINFGSNTYNSIGLLAIFGLAALRLMPIASRIVAGLNDFRGGKIAADIIFDEISDLKSLESNNIKFIKDEKKLDFNNLIISEASFGYDGMQKSIIEKLSLEINSGDKIGIIGESGAGKSTLINILMGFLPLQKGSILLNNEKINSENFEELQSLVAYLPQETFLISGTILENIAFCDKQDEIDYDKIYDCIKKANLDSFVESLNDGLYTQVGDRGITISGGQRQRVALARAFYFNRKILVLDEATSSLDTTTENKIIEEVKLLSSDITIIIVSHKINSLDGCNKVYSINKGKVIYQGNYSDLINKKNNE